MGSFYLGKIHIFPSNISEYYLLACKHNNAMFVFSARRSDVGVDSGRDQCCRVHRHNLQTSNQVSCR